MANIFRRQRLNQPGFLSHGSYERIPRP